MARFNLNFETYSSEVIGKDHYRLYTTLQRNDGSWTIVHCDYVNGELCEFVFYDRKASLAEIRQAYDYFEYKLYDKAFYLSS